MPMEIRTSPVLGMAHSEEANASCLTEMRFSGAAMTIISKVKAMRLVQREGLNEAWSVDCVGDLS